MPTQSFAVDELHGDKRALIPLANIVDRADSRMVQRRCGLSFASEALQSLRVLRHVVGKEFQRNGAVQASVDSLVHYTHSPSTKFLYDAKVRNGPVNHG